MEPDPIARADHLQRTAFELLDRIHLVELWQAHGTVLPVGSLRTGLMVEPNMDFNILTDELDLDAFFDVLHAVVRNTVARNAGARNTVEFDDVFVHLGSRLNRPHPYLAGGIGLKYAGEEWGIDHLIFGRDHPHAHYAHQATQAILNALDGEKRLTLLRIKHERLQRCGIHQKGGGGLDSLDIYRAFFDGGAATYAECEAWAASHPREEYVCWVPSA